MAFTGWPEEALDFYDGLEADNSRTYWTAHRAIYDEKVLGPMTELTEELAEEFGEAKIFRPYRDVRFSRDKTPYKTHIGAVIGGAGYVQLSAEGLGAGAGMWEMSPQELARYREAVADDGPGTELEQIIAVIGKDDITVHGHGVLKSAPRGYPADHPRIGLLRYKGVTAWRQWPVEPWLETASAKDHLVSFFRTVQPLRSWLAAHVSRLCCRSVSLGRPLSGHAAARVDHRLPGRNRRSAPAWTAAAAGGNLAERYANSAGGL